MFGLETGENPATRAAWNDVDDYNGWTESPPQTKSGTVIPDFSTAPAAAISATVSPVDMKGTGEPETGLPPWRASLGAAARAGTRTSTAFLTVLGPGAALAISILQ